MNRYIVIDLKELCISHLAKVETDFDINGVQTSSITCTDEEDLIKELKNIISEMENCTTEELEKESESQCAKGSAEEMSDIIYDTLFGNTHFPQFNIEKLTEINDMGDTQQVDRGKKEITFGYCGHIYKIHIEMINEKTNEELEIFKRVVRDYRKMEKELNDRVEQGYRIQELYDYIRHLSTCYITNYHIENYDDTNYIDFDYNDMCVSIYENKEGKCYLSNDIKVWNDKEGYLIDYTSIKNLEQLVKEMI